MNYIQYTQPTILILDSGVGGLSIYTAMRRILPNAQYLYFFDNKSFPYGKHSSEFIIHRIIKIITTFSKIYQLNLVIIACCTASLASLKILKNYFLFPIVKTIPNIRYALQYTQNGTIGIVATKYTIHHYYNLNLTKHFTSKYKIILLQASELVNIAEKKIHGENVQTLNFLKIFEPWLKKLPLPDTIILGCTHFYLLKQELIQIFPKKIFLIDPINYVITYSIFLLKKNKYKTLHKPYQKKYHKAYCSLHTLNTLKIKPILLSKYHFISLEILEI